MLRDAGAVGGELRPAAEAGELATATSLKAYLPTVGWDDYTATDADGDGFDDEIMISYDANGHTDSDTIDIYCQCLDGAARDGQPPVQRA